MRLVKAAVGLGCFAELTDAGARPYTCQEVPECF